MNESKGWKALALLLLIPLTAVVNGFVLVKLWSWFVVTTFGIRPLRVPEAIGVTLVVRFLTTSSGDAHAKHGVGEGVALAFIFPLFALFFGWVYHLFL